MSILIVVGMLLAFVGGIIVGSYWSDSQSVYRTTRPISLVDAEGQEFGRLPVGTRVISEMNLDPIGDLGWGGLVPVYLGTSSEAARFLQQTSEDETSALGSDSLNGVTQDDVLKSMK